MQILIKGPSILAFLRPFLRPRWRHRPTASFADAKNASVDDPLQHARIQLREKTVEAVESGKINLCPLILLFREKKNKKKKNLGNYILF
jgi:hypothetical protein